MEGADVPVSPIHEYFGLPKPTDSPDVANMKKGRFADFFAAASIDPGRRQPKDCALWVNTNCKAIIGLDAGSGQYQAANKIKKFLK